MNGIPFLAKPIKRCQLQPKGQGLYDGEAMYVSDQDFEAMLRSDDATSFLESLKWSIINLPKFTPKNLSKLLDEEFDERRKSRPVPHPSLGVLPVKDDLEC